MIELNKLAPEYLRKMHETDDFDVELVDKIRCFFETSRNNYLLKFSQKWGSDHWLISFLCIKIIYKIAHNRDKIDFVYINALLWFMDDSYFINLLKRVSSEEKSLLLEIQKDIEVIISDSTSYTPPKDENFTINNFQCVDGSFVKNDFSVILLCPNPMSLYSLLSLELLKRQGITIKAVFIKNIFSLSRFKSEFRRDGIRLIKKVWRKLILRRSESGLAGKKIDDLIQELNIQKQSVKAWCTNNSIHVTTVKDFSSSSIISTINRDSVDLCVFTGGGIINDSLLAAPRVGVLNCHMGILPAYRGMDVVQWPLLEERYDQVGLCTHLMRKKIDAGPIIDVKYIDVKSFKDLYTLRNAIEKEMPKFLIDAVCALRSGQKLYEQNVLKRTYFRMHPKLESRIKVFKI